MRLADKRIQWLAVLGTSAGALVPLYAADPARGGVFPRCPIHALTGLYCPGCGTTRALHQLLHGNLLAALRLNPLLLVLLPILAYSFLSFTREAFCGRALPNLLRTRLVRGLLIGTVLTFTVLRNIPRYPCTLLAPHAAAGR